MVGNAVWLNIRTQTQNPYFEFEVQFGSLSDAPPDSPAPLPILSYSNGNWSFEGKLVAARDIRQYVRKSGEYSDGPATSLEYYLDSDATFEDFAQSSRDAWAAGAEGAGAILKGGFDYTEGSVVGMGVYKAVPSGG